MGMYDSVRFECTKCGGDVEAQSKAGECALTEFSPYQVPMVIAADMIGDTVSCRDCGERYTVEGHVPPFVELWIR